MPSLSETMTVARIDEDYGIGVTKMPIPAIPPRGALVKVVGCGVCGSDLDKFVHKKSNPGSILGHEMVGIIEALDEGHPGDWKVGDRLVSSAANPSGSKKPSELAYKSDSNNIGHAAESCFLRRCCDRDLHAHGRVSGIGIRSCADVVTHDRNRAAQLRS